MDQNNVSVKEKRLGISKRKDRWQARVRDPTFKRRICLGTFGTPEEAAAVVKKKRAEFAELNKLKDAPSFSRDRTRVDFEGNVLPVGVRRRGECSWEAQLYRPELKGKIYIGTYRSLEEASAAVKKKRAELGYVTESREVELDPRCKGVDVVLDDELHNKALCGSPAPVLKALVSNDGNIRDKSDLGEDTQSLGFKNKVTDNTATETSGLDCEGKKPPPRDCKRGYDFEGNMLPVGVRRRGNCRWEAQIWLPELKRSVYIGSYDCPEKAAAAVDKKKAEFAHKNESKKGGELDPKCKGEDVVMVDELKNKFVYYSPTSVLKPMISTSSSREDNPISGFDEAVSLGFINEYGQLQGKYSILDEQMELCLPDEDVVLEGLF